jgi:hypothetical protein
VPLRATAYTGDLQEASMLPCADEGGIRRNLRSEAHIGYEALQPRTTGRVPTRGASGRNPTRILP